MTLNRQITPGFNAIENLHFPSYGTHQTINGLNYYTLIAGNEPVVRVEIVFDAGIIKQSEKGEAGFVASMLSEGTKSKTALALADALDYYGSYFQVRSNAEDCIATLYCLDKHLENCLPHFFDALMNSIFPEKELTIQKRNSIQKLLVSKKKNSYVCRKTFYQTLLGADHALASFSEKEDIQAINRDALVKFYQKNILKGYKYAILSGKVSEEGIKTFSDMLTNSGLESSNSSYSISTGKKDGNYKLIAKNESVQSSIRIGATTINRKHADFRKLQFLNLIFGGYFGSRLMKNIREDKGLTYGIYSVLETYKDFSIWYIDCDLNYKNRLAGIEEIRKEIEKIKTEPISTEELKNAKNYYLGSFLKSLDGPFSLADRLKIIIDNELSPKYYSDFVTLLNAIDSGELHRIANEYLIENNMIEIIVGKE